MVWRLALAALLELLLSCSSRGSDIGAPIPPKGGAAAPCPCGAGCACANPKICPACCPVAGAVKTLEGNWIAPDGKGGWRFVESAPKVQPKKSPDSGVIPGPTTPARGYWIRQCDGKGSCRLVWVTVP